MRICAGGMGDTEFVRRRTLDAEQTEAWVLSLIAAGKLHLFYISKPWIHARDQVMQEQHYECQDCKQAGRFSPAEVVHHVKPLRMYPRLALTKSNLVCLCASCHWVRHHPGRRGDVIAEEAW